MNKLADDLAIAGSGPSHTMRRVLVVGSSGAGKSTLSTELAAKLDLPLIHLDAEFWQPGWVEMPKQQWKERVASLVARERWVMDGNYSGTLAERVPASDTVVLLDYSRVLCLFRVIKRAIRFRGRTRPDLSVGCPEQVPSAQFLWWIWSYPKRSLPKVLRILQDNPQCHVIILKSPAAARVWLSRVTSTETSIAPTKSELSS